MKSEWSLTTLGKVATNESRRFNFHNKDKVVFINTGDVLEGKFIKSDYIDSQGLPGQAKKAIKPNDILFSEIRPANKRNAFVDFDSANYVVSTKFMVIKASALISVKYLFLVLTSNIMLRELQQIAESRSGTFPQITFDAVSHIPINLPPLPTQKSIAHILSTLDDKIELNRKMNQTLESMAQAIFKSWFVDFAPVHSKAGVSSEDELDKVANDLGISRKVLDLFPSEFEESELGLIPKGWEQDVLSTHISIIKGKSYKSSELEESQTALVTLKSFLRGGGYRIDGIKPYTGKYKEEQVVMPGELIMAYTDVTQVADVIGKPALVLEDENIDTLVASLDVGIVRASSERLNKMYLYQLFKTTKFQGYILGYTSGTTVLHLKKNWADSYTVLLPHEGLMSRFNNIAQGLFETFRLNAEQNKTLQKTRDILLPKLLSGELDVSNLNLGLSDD